MADFNLLSDGAPGFMELDSICTPPIDFAMALRKARESTEKQVRELNNISDLREAALAVKQDMRVTFSFLLMQLHKRGSQSFWATVDENKAFAYLAFRVVDLYADVLTHITTPGFDCAATLDSVTSKAFLDPLKAEFLQLLSGIRAQRSRHMSDPSWFPSDSDLRDVMESHGNRRVLVEFKRMALEIVVGVALVAGIAVLTYSLLRRRAP